jgi:hypothetical protein
METGFPDKQEKKYKAIKNPWDFRMPMYDERTSCYTNAGSHYGIGYCQPVGHEGKAALHVDTLPYGKVKTQQTYWDNSDNLPIDVVQ